MPPEQRRFTFDEACRAAGIEHAILIEFVRQHWIAPCAPEAFDDEDVARARLIHELRDDLGANDEAVSIILHLLDQLYALHARLDQAA